MLPGMSTAGLASGPQAGFPLETTSYIYLGCDRYLPRTVDREDMEKLTLDSGAWVQTFNIHPPYSADFGQRALGIDSLTHPQYVLVSSPDSLVNGNAIIRVSPSGVASDFIPHSALATLLTDGTFPERPVIGLPVDDQDRIYAVVTLYRAAPYTNHTRIRRFHSDGTFDADFDAAPLVLGTGGNILTYEGSIASWGCISSDGHYFYATMLWDNNDYTANPRTNYGSIIEYDLTAGMASREVYRYSFTHTNTFVDTPDGTQVYGVASGIWDLRSVAVDPDGELWVGWTRMNRIEAESGVGTRGTWTYVDAQALVDHILPDGTLIETIDIGAASVDPVWDSQKVVGTPSNGTGSPGNFFWVGRMLYGVLDWATQWDDPENRTGTHGKIFNLSIDSKEVTFLRDYDAGDWGNNFPFVILGPSISPGLARYPARNAAATWGPPLVGAAA